MSYAVPIGVFVFALACAGVATIIGRRTGTARRIRNDKGDTDD